MKSTAASRTCLRPRAPNLRVTVLVMPLMQNPKQTVPTGFSAVPP